MTGNEALGTAPAVEQERPPGFLTRIAFTFASPGRLFAAVDQRPGTWWQPLLLVAIVNGLLIHLIFDRVIVPAQIEAMEERGMEGAAIDQARDFLEGGAGRSLAIASTVLGTPIVALVGALAIHVLAVTFLGGRGRFSRTWGVMSHVLLVGLPENAAKVPVMLADGSPEVSFGPALFLPRGEPSPFLFNLIAQVDAFTVWKVILLAAGLAAVHRIARGPVLIACFLLWGVWALAAASLAGAFGG
jgi:hypothetical protein